MLAGERRSLMACRERNPVFAYLLNLIYLAVLAVASPWLLWQAWRKGKYRAGFAQKFLGRVPVRVGDRPCVWLHAVSVGEVNLLATLMRELLARRPDLELVISTTSRAGYELAQKKYAEHTVCYCPLDFSWAVRTAMQRLRPELLILAELELWPNLIRAADEYGAKIFVMNGRLSETSFRRYRYVRPLLVRILRRLDGIGAQNDEYAERFRQLGAPPATVQVTGSLKYDGAQTNRRNPTTERLRRLAGITESDTIFLAGSTQAGEESVALAAFQNAAVSAPGSTKLRMVLVPRHPERFSEVADLLANSGLRWRRRSELADHSPADWEVLLIDTIGELGAWWGTAQIAFVGGSLGNRGGQNMLEPAAYGAAVCFGPNTRNFRDIVAALLAANGATVVANADELTEFIRRCLCEPAFAAEQGARAAELVRQNLGATARTVELLLPMLPATTLPARAA